MSKGNTDEKFIAGLIRRSGLEEPPLDFTDRVMQSVELLPRPQVIHNGSAHKAWFLFALGTVLMVPAVILLGWMVSLYRAWFPGLTAEHVQYFSYGAMLLFCLFALYQFDLLIKYRFGR